MVVVASNTLVEREKEKKKRGQGKKLASDWNVRQAVHQNCMKTIVD